MARILSIEDDPDLQHLLALGLRSEGFEVHYAFTGEEGYEKILLLSPDLIILDLMLPVLNGIEVLRKLKANRRLKAIPVIVMTAFTEDERFLESEARSLGAVEYIQKPVRIEVLQRVIRRLLRRAPPPRLPPAAASSSPS